MRHRGSDATRTPYDDGDGARVSKRHRIGGGNEYTLGGDGKYYQLHREHGHSTEESSAKSCVRTPISVIYIWALARCKPSSERYVCSGRLRFRLRREQQRYAHEIMPHHVMVTRVHHPAPLDTWCIDLSASCHLHGDHDVGHYRCRDVRKCNVDIKSSDDDAYFLCTEMDTTTITCFNENTGRRRRLNVIMSNVLISPKFTFHIM